MTDKPIALAERIFQVLDQGRFTATYKYAVFLGLLDLCLLWVHAQEFATIDAAALGAALG